MRDLARSGLGRGRKKTNRSKKLLYLAAFIVLGVVLYYIGGDAGGGAPKGNGLVADAPPDLTPVSLADQGNLASGGVNLTSNTANMKDLRGGASANIVRSYGGGEYKLNVNADLPDPVNVSYALWLTGSGNPRLVDYLRGSGNTWYLNITGKSSEFMKYDGVIISLERTKDNKVEEKIMEGSF